jgi:hypothetical protein
MVGAKEVRVKTSKGDGRTLTVSLKPQYAHDEDAETAGTHEHRINAQIIDFAVTRQETAEEMQGTIIERLDESE